MKQQLGRAAFRPENAVSGDDALPNKVAMEIDADGFSERVLLARRVVAFRPAKDSGVSADLLVKQRDRPTAHHPVTLRGVDWLERVVPVSVSIPNQVCPRHEASAHALDELVDMRRDGVRTRGLLESVVAPPCASLVEERQISGRFDIVAKRLQRPHDDIAVRAPVPKSRNRAPA